MSSFSHFLFDSLSTRSRTRVQDTTNEVQAKTYFFLLLEGFTVQEGLESVSKSLKKREGDGYGIKYGCLVLG